VEYTEARQLFHLGQWYCISPSAALAGRLITGGAAKTVIMHGASSRVMASSMAVTIAAFRSVSVRKGLVDGAMTARGKRGAVLSRLI
jgi:hypothetical protein